MYGLLDLIQKYPSLLRKLFVYDPSTALTATQMLQLFVPDLNPKGSNLREIEDGVLLNWNDFVQDLGSSSISKFDYYVLQRSIIVFSH